MVIMIDDLIVTNLASWQVPDLICDKTVLASLGSLKNIKSCSKPSANVLVHNELCISLSICSDLLLLGCQLILVPES